MPQSGVPYEALLQLLRQRQGGQSPPGAQPSRMVGPGYGAPNPGLGDGSSQRGQVQLGPNPPSPGLGMGAPMPGQYEDQSFGYQNAGQNQDPLLAMIAALLNQRFPNNG